MGFEYDAADKKWINTCNTFTIWKRPFVPPHRVNINELHAKLGIAVEDRKRSALTDQEMDLWQTTVSDSMGLGVMPDTLAHWYHDSKEYFVDQ